MIYNENTTEKKRQNNFLSFLQNGKYHFLNTMGYNNSSGSSSNSKKVVMTNGIFGAPLKSATICGSTNEYGLTVPDPVYRCFDEILKRGLLTEGIFRLSGTAPEVETLSLDFDKPPTYGKYLDLKNYDIHAIAGVVKKYLRLLPDPVIPISHHEQFIQLYDESFSDKSTTYTMATLIQQLPKEHFHLIHYIIYLTSKIQQHADINMMNPEALAVVLAPVCTGLEQNLKEIPSSRIRRQSRTKMMTDMGHFIETNAKWTQIWSLLIEYSDTLLELWKETITWQVMTPHHNNTVPCHRPQQHHYHDMSHPNRYSGTYDQTELLLNIVPPTTQHHQQEEKKTTSDDLYKVVVIRQRQHTCRSFTSKKKRSKNTPFHSNPSAASSLTSLNSTITMTL